MLTILSVGYPFAAVSPDAVGGAEQVLAAIDAALVEAGHRSIVIAPESSACRGELRPVPLAGRIDACAVQAAHEAVRERIRQALQTERVDVVHLHGVDFARYLPETELVPLMATLHLWPDAYPCEVFARPDLHLQCVSEAQRRACPTPRSPVVIRNGVDLRELHPGAAEAVSEDERGFVLALGRICPEKGFHLAIDAARDAGLPILLAGAVYPYETHQRYFESAIVPRLGPDVRFLGPIDRARKRRLLASARCVVLPSTVRETSSLVAMESLASGTPVVALRSPALEELIDEGRTGRLVDRPGALPRALREAGAISRLACRHAAEERCSAARMTAEYLRCYAELARDRSTRV